MSRYLSKEKTGAVLGEVLYGGGLRPSSILNLISTQRFPNDAALRKTVTEAVVERGITRREAELLREAVAVNSLREFLRSVGHGDDDPALQSKIKSLDAALKARDFRAVFLLKDLYDLFSERHAPQLEKHLNETWADIIRRRNGAEKANAIKKELIAEELAKIIDLKKQFPKISGPAFELKVARDFGISRKTAAKRIKQIPKTA